MKPILFSILCFVILYLLVGSVFAYSIIMQERGVYICQGMPEQLKSELNADDAFNNFLEKGEATIFGSSSADIPVGCHSRTKPGSREEWFNGSIHLFLWLPLILGKIIR